MAGLLSGTIRDVRTGQPIEGATVTVQPGGSTTTSSYNRDTDYSLPVDAGTYELTVTSSWYDTWTAPGIFVADDVTTEINIAMWPKDT